MDKPRKKNYLDDYPLASIESEADHCEGYNQACDDWEKWLSENSIEVKSKGQLKRIYSQMGIDYVPKENNGK